MKRVLFGLLVVMLALPLTAQEMEQVTINFVAMVGDQPAACGMTYEGIGSDEAAITFGDFRLYISNVQLVAADGTLTPLMLEQDGLWQYENVALLDFETGDATCADIGNAALNGSITGSAPTGDYVGVQFDLGVPFALNHADVTTAPSPLNVTAMWWNWQFGYKFVRIDVVTDAPAAETSWAIHLGSTGCDSAAGVIPPALECAQPNISTIRFDAFDLASEVIVVDLAGLLDNVPLHENTPMPPGCMSGDDPDCYSLFPNLGLSLVTGQCLWGNCDQQSLFRVAPMDGMTLIERTTMMMSGGAPESGQHGGHSGHGG